MENLFEKIKNYFTQKDIYRNPMYKVTNGDDEWTASVNSLSKLSEMCKNK